MITEKLTSVRLQPMINMDKMNLDLLCPILKFGRKKSGEFKFPVVFSNKKQAEKCYDDLEKLKGKSFEEVKSASEAMFDKYKKFNYLKKQKTKVKAKKK